MKFDTKIVIILRDDLQTWQELNMTAFLVSGIATTSEGIVGEPYEDGSGNLYLPMFRQPVMVFSANQAQIREVYNRFMANDLRFSVFTEDLFNTGNDIDNRAAVKAVAQHDLRLVGLAVHGHKKQVDNATKGLTLHK